jgi:hypothetical protein
VDPQYIQLIILQHLLNVSVQLANKSGIKNKKQKQKENKKNKNSSLGIKQYIFHIPPEDGP